MSKITDHFKTNPALKKSLVPTSNTKINNLNLKYDNFEYDSQETYETNQNLKQTSNVKKKIKYGRLGKDKKGCSRRLCLKCEKRVGGKLKKKTNIIDQNYCSIHQPFDINQYLKEKKNFPKYWLSCEKNLKIFLQGVFDIENIKSNDDIYKYERVNFQKYFSSILSKYPNICQKMIDLFPEKNLKWYKFKTIPENYLDKLKYRKELFNNFLDENEIDINSDLNDDTNKIYNITLKDIEKHKAGTLFNYTKHSVYHLFKEFYPNKKFIPWYFKGLNYYFVDENNKINVANVKKWFMKEIYLKYNLVSCEEKDKIHYILLDINVEDLINSKGGAFICNHFSASRIKFINEIYPEYNIKFWELNRIPINYLDNKNNLKELIDYIILKEGWTSINEYFNLDESIFNKYCSCYNVIRKKFTDHSKGTVCMNLLNFLFPNYDFSKMIDNSYGNQILEYFNPNNYETKKNLRKLVDENLYKLNYTTKEEHYYLKYEDFTGRIKNIMKKYYEDKYVNLIIDIYPENEYDISKFNCYKFNKQLIVIINRLCNIKKINYKNLITEKTFENLKNINSLKFDVCIEIILNKKLYYLCFEKDGEQHFKPKKFFGGEEKFKKQRNNDILKHKYIKSNDNILLIRISYKEFRNRDTFSITMDKLLDELLNNYNDRKIYVSNNDLYKDFI